MKKILNKVYSRVVIYSVLVVSAFGTVVQAAMASGDGGPFC